MAAAWLWVTGCANPLAQCPPGDGVGLWSSLPELHAPPHRYAHALAGVGDLFVVWGGVGPNGEVLGDGGRLDPAANEWLSMDLHGAPSPRAEMASVAAVGPDGAWLVVFGGQDRGAVGTLEPHHVRDDGALYDPLADAWTPLPLGPPARYRAAMAADPASGRAYLVGGLDEHGQPRTDAWQLDLSVRPPQWTALAGSLPLVTAQERRPFLARPIWLAHRSTSSALGMLVALSGLGTGRAQMRAATYALPNGPWVLDDQVSAPPARVGEAVAWAPNADRMVVHGGTSAQVAEESPADPLLQFLVAFAPPVPDTAQSGAYRQGTNTFANICSDDPGDCGYAAVTVPRTFHAATWLGDLLLVVGGLDPGQCGGGAAWDPRSSTWSRLGFSQSPYRGSVPAISWLPGIGVVAFGQHRPASLSDQPAGGALWVP